MNISTYEARIAALEAQLGPGPSGGRGIESILISPDIGGINAVLAATSFYYEDGLTSDEVPEWGRLISVTKNTTDFLPETVDVTVTPSDGLYAVYMDPSSGVATFGDVGAPATFKVGIVEGVQLYSFSVAVVNSNDLSTCDWGVFAKITVRHAD